VKLNISDRDPAFSIAEDGLLCQARLAQQWCGARADIGVLNGMLRNVCAVSDYVVGAVYYEVTVVDEGLCRIGWSTTAAKLDLGTDQYGFGFGGTGKKSNNRKFEDYGEPYGKGDTVGSLYDTKTGIISFTKNGMNAYIKHNETECARQTLRSCFHCSGSSCSTRPVSCYCRQSMK